MSVATAPQITPHQPSATAGVPNPPRMAILLYLFLSASTLGIFPMIWGFRVSSWIRNIDPKSHATALWSVSTVIAVIGSVSFLVSFITASLVIVNGPVADITIQMYVTIFQFALLLVFVGLIFMLVAVYSARKSLLSYFNSNEPIHLKINDGLTFFLNIFYLQYKLNEVCARRGNARATADYHPLVAAGVANPPKIPVLLYLFFSVVTFGLFLVIWASECLPGCVR